MTALRDLRPADPPPTLCRGCMWHRFGVVIILRVAYWRCNRCGLRPDDFPPAPPMCGVPARSTGRPCRYLVDEPGQRCPAHRGRP